MEKQRLSGCDLEVSRLCFGTMTFGKQVDQPLAERMIGECVDAGINFFDTANIYQHGQSEIILGDALRGKRGQVILASKVRGKMGEGPDESGLSRQAILRAIDESLRRLKTDYLDIYYLHQPDYATPIEETLETVEELVRQGKVRCPGSSNYSSWQVCRQLWLAEAKAYKPARITQPMYNLLARGIEQEYLPMARELGVSTVVYNPLAGGLLTGKQSAGAPIPGTRFDGNTMYLNRYWHPAYFEAVEELKRAAQQDGRTLVSVALNWLLHHTGSQCVILGASSLEQLHENIRLSREGRLTEAMLKQCDEIWSKLRGITPQYNR
ncbi:MAG: aldo/keto reductase [Bryobacteraceae bacterium]